MKAGKRCKCRWVSLSAVRVHCGCRDERLPLAWESVPDPLLITIGYHPMHGWMSNDQYGGKFGMTRYGDLR